MAFNEFFGNKDKPYAENLNDSLLLLDAFDVTVPVRMPDMFSNGEFASNLNLARKCGVGIITLISNSGVTIGTNSITGTGEVVFRVYPNFNGFYKWQSIILQKTGTVNVAFRKPDGSSISATVSADGIISENNALKQLLEVDLVLTLSNATISSILINFINNHTKTDRVSALLEASQLANVNGSVATGNTEAVSGGTVKTALDNLHTTVTGEIEDLSDSITGETDSKLALKEDKSNKVTTLDTNSAHYPSCTAVNNGLVLKENLSNKVTSLDNSNTHYPTTSAIQPIISSMDDILAIIFSFTPNFTRGLFLNVNNSIVKSVTGTIIQVTYLVQEVMGTPKPVTETATTTKIESTLGEMFTFPSQLSGDSDQRITIKAISPLTNEIIFNKTYDHDGNVVS